MAEEKTLKSKFILKWKHGISDEGEDLTNDPSVVAQRYINLYKCFQFMKPHEQAAYIEELKQAPDALRRLFLKATGGREVEAFYRYVKNGDIKPLAVEDHEKEEAVAAEKIASQAIAAVEKMKQIDETPPPLQQGNVTPPPPPPTF